MRGAFLASKSLGLKLLRTFDLNGSLILHPDDSGDDRSVMPAFKQLGAHIVRTPEDADAALRDYCPDIVFVCGWYWLLSDETRALAPKGFFGIHNSLLPKYRGGAPLVWAIIHGEERVGSSLFRLDGGIDDGPIAHQFAIGLPRTANVADAGAMIEAEWELVFPGVWRGLCEGTVALRPQEGTPTTFPNRDRSDGLIDWSLPAAKVHDFIRAQAAPYPGAFSGGTIYDFSFERGRTGAPVVCGDGKALHVAARIAKGA